MAKITFKGSPIQTSGELPRLNSKAPDFELVASDLSRKTLKDFQGKKLILNVFVSIDTSVCATSAAEFNKRAVEFPDTFMLCISQDLPFAHKRYCESHHLSNIIPLSDFRDHSFGKKYGLTIVDGPLSGLLARAVLVLNKNHEIVYEELVPEIAQEPNYEKAIEALGASPL